MEFNSPITSISPIEPCIRTPLRDTTNQCLPSSTKKTEAESTPKSQRISSKPNEVDTNFASSQHSTPKKDCDTESDTTAEYESAGESSPWGKETSISTLADCLEGIHLSTPEKRTYSKLNHFPFSPITAEDESDEEITAIISRNSSGNTIQGSLSLLEKENSPQNKSSNSGQNIPIVVVSPSQVVGNHKDLSVGKNCILNERDEKSETLEVKSEPSLNKSIPKTPETTLPQKNEHTLEVIKTPNKVSPSLEFQDAGPACSFHSEVMNTLEAQILSGTPNSSIMSNHSLIIEGCRHSDSASNTSSDSIKGLMNSSFEIHGTKTKGKPTQPRSSLGFSPNCSKSSCSKPIPFINTIHGLNSSTHERTPIKGSVETSKNMQSSQSNSSFGQDVDEACLQKCGTLKENLDEICEKIESTNLKPLSLLLEKNDEADNIGSNSNNSSSIINTLELTNNEPTFATGIANYTYSLNKITEDLARSSLQTISDCINDALLEEPDPICISPDQFDENSFEICDVSSMGINNSIYYTDRTDFSNNRPYSYINNINAIDRYVHTHNPPMSFTSDVCKSPLQPVLNESCLELSTMPNLGETIENTSLTSNLSDNVNASKGAHVNEVLNKSIENTLQYQDIAHPEAYSLDKGNSLSNMEPNKILIKSTDLNLSEQNSDVCESPSLPGISFNSRGKSLSIDSSEIQMQHSVDSLEPTADINDEMLADVNDIIACDLQNNIKTSVVRKSVDKRESNHVAETHSSLSFSLDSLEGDGLVDNNLSAIATPEKTLESKLLDQTVTAESVSNNCGLSIIPEKELTEKSPNPVIQTLLNKSTEINQSQIIEGIQPNKIIMGQTDNKSDQIMKITLHDHTNSKQTHEAPKSHQTNQCVLERKEKNIEEMKHDNSVKMQLIDQTNEDKQFLGPFASQKTNEVLMERPEQSIEEKNYAESADIQLVDQTSENKKPIEIQLANKVIMGQTENDIDQCVIIRSLDQPDEKKIPHETIEIQQITQVITERPEHITEVKKQEVLDQASEYKKSPESFETQKISHDIMEQQEKNIAESVEIKVLDQSNGGKQSSETIDTQKISQFIMETPIKATEAKKHNDSIDIQLLGQTTEDKKSLKAIETQHSDQVIEQAEKSIQESIELKLQDKTNEEKQTETSETQQISQVIMEWPELSTEPKKHNESVQLPDQTCQDKKSLEAIETQLINRVIAELPEKNMKESIELKLQDKTNEEKQTETTETQQISQVIMERPEHITEVKKLEVLDQASEYKKSPESVETQKISHDIMEQQEKNIAESVEIKVLDQSNGGKQSFETIDTQKISQFIMETPIQTTEAEEHDDSIDIQLLSQTSEDKNSLKAIETQHANQGIEQAEKSSQESIELKLQSKTNEEKQTETIETQQISQVIMERPGHITEVKKLEVLDQASEYKKSPESFETQKISHDIMEQQEKNIAKSVEIKVLDQSNGGKQSFETIDTQKISQFIMETPIQTTEAEEHDDSIDIQLLSQTSEDKNSLKAIETQHANQGIEQAEKSSQESIELKLQSKTNEEKQTETIETQQISQVIMEWPEQSTEPKKHYESVQLPDQTSQDKKSLEAIETQLIHRVIAELPEKNIKESIELKLQDKTNEEKQAETTETQQISQVIMERPGHITEVKKLEVLDQASEYKKSPESFEAQKISHDIMEQQEKNIAESVEIEVLDQSNVGKQSEIFETQQIRPIIMEHSEQTTEAQQLNEYVDIKLLDQTNENEQSLETLKITQDIKECTEPSPEVKRIDQAVETQLLDQINEAMQDTKVTEQDQIFNAVKNIKNTEVDVESPLIVGLCEIVETKQLTPAIKDIEQIECIMKEPNTHSPDVIVPTAQEKTSVSKQLNVLEPNEAKIVLPEERIEKTNSAEIFKIEQVVKPIHQLGKADHSLTNQDIITKSEATQLLETGLNGISLETAEVKLLKTNVEIGQSEEAIAVKHSDHIPDMITDTKKTAVDSNLSHSIIDCEHPSQASELKPVALTNDVFESNTMGTDASNEILQKNDVTDAVSNNDKILYQNSENNLTTSQNDIKQLDLEIKEPKLSLPNTSYSANASQSSHSMQFEITTVHPSDDINSGGNSIPLHTVEALNSSKHQVPSDLQFSTQMSPQKAHDGSSTASITSININSSTHDDSSQECQSEDIIPVKNENNILHEAKNSYQNLNISASTISSFISRSVGALTGIISPEKVCKRPESLTSEISDIHSSISPSKKTDNSNTNLGQYEHPIGTFSNISPSNAAYGPKNVNQECTTNTGDLLIQADRSKSPINDVGLVHFMQSENNDASNLVKTNATNSPCKLSDLFSTSEKKIEAQQPLTPNENGNEESKPNESSSKNKGISEAMANRNIVNEQKSYSDITSAKLKSPYKNETNIASFEIKSDNAVPHSKITHEAQSLSANGDSQNSEINDMCSEQMLVNSSFVHSSVVNCQERIGSDLNSPEIKMDNPISPDPSHSTELSEGKMTTGNNSVSMDMNITRDLSKSPLNKSINHTGKTGKQKVLTDCNLNKCTPERKSYEDLLDKCLQQEQLLSFDDSIKEEAEKIANELSSPESLETLSEPRCVALQVNNTSEAGPTTANEDLNKADCFQDAANFDFEYLSKIRGKPGRRQLIRESLFLKFDPLATSSTPESESSMEQKQRTQPDSSTDAVVTPPRPPVNGDEMLVSITPSVSHVSPASSNTPRTRPRPSSGNTTPSFRQEIVSKEICRLQDVMLKQEFAYQEQLATCEEEIEELKSRIEELESQELLQQLEERCVEAEAEVASLRNTNSELNSEVDELRLLIDEYDATLNQLINKRTMERKEFEAEKEKLVAERDESTQHLRTMEICFNDVHQKYEKSKEAISQFKHNEVQFKAALAENEKAILQGKENYHKLKEHATQKLEEANKEIVEMKKAHQGEMAKLTAINRKLEIQVKSLEDCLEQKKKEVAELTKICDELITKFAHV